MTPPIRPGPAVAAIASISRDVDAGFVDHPPDQAGQDLDMGAGGDFGNDAAIGLVRRVLADDGVGEDPPVAADDRGGAVVARGFEAEDQSHCAALCLNRPAMH